MQGVVELYDAGAGVGAGAGAGVGRLAASIAGATTSKYSFVPIAPTPANAGAIWKAPSYNYKSIHPRNFQNVIKLEKIH